MTKCKCDLRTKLVGDGCRYCNPQDYIDHLHDAIAEKSEWVGLTDEEIEDEWSKFMSGASDGFVPTFVKAIEAALRSKNT